MDEDHDNPPAGPDASAEGTSAATEIGPRDDSAPLPPPEAGSGCGPEPDCGARQVDAPRPDLSVDDEAAAEVTPESVTEAVLFATDAPLPAQKIARILGVGDARSVKKHIEALNARYEQSRAAYRIEEVGEGFQMLTLPAYNNWVSKLLAVRRETKLSPAALETLAVVAYRQPVLRADIEAVRGVAGGDVLNRLREMGLVKIIGRAEIIGRPMLYGTTKKFLEVFGLASLDDLPKVDALALPTHKAPPGESEANPPAEPNDGPQ